MRHPHTISVCFSIRLPENEMMENFLWKRS